MEVVIGLIVLLVMGWIFWYEIPHYKKRNTIHLDARGYERNGYGRLVHRDVAYRYLYKYPKYSKRFRDYDIHHIDRNKRNNSSDNLEILTREEHEERHRIN